MSERINAIRRRLEARLEQLIANAAYDALKDMHRDLLRQMSNDKVVESTIEELQREDRHPALLEGKV